MSKVTLEVEMGERDWALLRYYYETGEPTDAVVEVLDRVASALVELIPPLEYERRIKVAEALDWKLNDSTLRSMLYAEAEQGCPAAIVNSNWTGEIRVEGDEFVVAMTEGY